MFRLLLVLGRLLLPLWLLSFPAIADAVYTFSLLPADGAVGGTPGSTIGWGYSIDNESSSLWLVTSGLNSDSFLNATPDAIFDFPDLAPGEKIIVPFDASKSIGLYELIWDVSAPIGFVNAGRFVLSAQWWNGDPASGGSFVGSAPDANNPYEATVTPEPLTIGPAGLSLLLILSGFCRRSGQRAIQPK